MDSYSAMEGQGTQTVNAVLQSGILTQSVVVTLQTDDTNPQATAGHKLIRIAELSGVMISMPFPQV